MARKATEKTIFPKWAQVIDQLYTTPPFKECNLGKDSRRHYQSQLKVFKKNFVFPLEDPEKIVEAFKKHSAGTASPPTASEKEMFEKYSSLNAHGNRFTLIGDATKMVYLQISENVKDILKLDSPKDFDLAKLCGFDPRFNLWNPFDVFHIIRLGEAILQTVCIKGINLNPYEDFYRIEFRIGHMDPERCKTVIRECRLSDPEQQSTGIRHMDVWHIEHNQDQFSHVNTSFISKSNQAMNEVIRNLSFATNCALLDIKPRDVLLANCLCQYSTGLCREKLNETAESHLRVSEIFGKKSFPTLKRNLKRLINNRIVENTKGAQYKKEVLDWSFYRKCAQLGIINVPEQLSSSMWKTIQARGI